MGGIIAKKELGEWEWVDNPVITCKQSNPLGVVTAVLPVNYKREHTHKKTEEYCFI